MEMDEEDQKDIGLIEAGFKEKFSDGVFMAYRKLTMIRWVGERVDFYTNRIRLRAGMAAFEGVGKTN